MAAGGTPAGFRIRGGARVLCAAAIAVLVALVAAGASSARLDRPAYTVGDRWVYALVGSIDSFPGLNESGFGGLALTLSGRVEDEVVATDVPVDSLKAVEIATRATGFLNGTIPVPGGGGAVATVAGIFTSTATELREDRGNFPVRTSSSTSYAADVTYLISTRLEIRTVIDARTTVVQDSVFPLEVGQTATADLTTDLAANSTITALGQTFTMANATTISSTWQRHVLSVETVSTEAGTFATFKVNQSLGFLPGIGSFLPLANGNETAYYANEVGSYVKRVAYANGTAVAELRLRSYVYAAAGAPPPFPVTTTVLVSAAVAAIAASAWLYRRERRRAGALEGRDGGPPASAPPSGSKGDDRAR